MEVSLVSFCCERQRGELAKIFSPCHCAARAGQEEKGAREGGEADEGEDSAIERERGKAGG